MAAPFDGDHDAQPSGAAGTEAGSAAPDASSAAADLPGAHDGDGTEGAPRRDAAANRGMSGKGMPTGSTSDDVVDAGDGASAPVDDGTSPSTSDDDDVLPGEQVSGGPNGGSSDGKADADSGGGPRRGPELDDATVAARWAELTATLGDLGGPPRRVDREPEAQETRVHHPRPLGPRDHEPGSGAPDDEDPASGIDGFVPPEPEPLSGADPVVALGWAAVIGSVLLGVLLAVFWQPVPRSVLGILGAVLVAGVGLLLWRMPDKRDHDDHSNGAVV